MYYSVDAIEGSLARLVDDEEAALYVAVSSLPEGISETDILTWLNGTWHIASKETARRKTQTNALLQELLGL